MIRVVDEACNYKGSRLCMVLESESLEELLSSQTVKLAVDEAVRFGMANGCLNSQDSPAPVNDKGETPEDYTELSKLAGTKGIKYWKRVYLVARF